LKKFVYIFTFIIGLNFTSLAQNKTTGPDPVAKLVKFGPNPASAYINFDFQRGYDKSFTFRVFSPIGKKIYEVKNVPEHINLSVTDYYRGLYLYQIIGKDEKIIESGKFFVLN